MSAYFFPLLILRPDFMEPIECQGVSISPRKWATSIFDLATLATKHRLHLPYQLMDVLLNACNCEVQVSNAESLEDAFSRFERLRIGLYVSGVSPFLCPLVSSESINCYSGINERDSAIERGLEPKIPSAFSSKVRQLEAWPYELAHQCAVLPESISISGDQFREAVAFSESWSTATHKSPALNALVAAVVSAPRLGSLPQSILHVWTGIESLLPSVNSEVSFRIALYLAIICEEPPKRASYLKHVKAAYNVRSKIAHGSSKSIGLAEWGEAWNLVLRAARAIARRGSIPTEEQLLAEVLDA